MKNRIYSLLVEPAGYTIDLIQNVYSFFKVDFAFMRSSSLASRDKICDEAMVLSNMGLIRRIAILYKTLRNSDGVIVNGYADRLPVLFIWLNILFCKKSMALESDTELRIPANIIKRALKWLWLHFLFTRKYCYGFAGGNYGHKELFRYYGMAEERIFLMPMMVDNNRYHRKEPAIAHKQFRFGYLGRLVKHKQVDKIIEALPQDCELHIVGDGEERAMLEAQAKGKQVHFYGNRFGDDKIRLLHSFDCLVLYSSYEPWGLVVNEALASGIPVIVSDKVGARRDLVEGKNPTGLVARWDDANDLAEKMHQMASNSELRSRLVKNAKLRMEHWDYRLYGSNFDAWRDAISK